MRAGWRSGWGVRGEEVGGTEGGGRVEGEKTKSEVLLFS